LLQGELVTLDQRLEEQSFCYDPDFPPEIPEGLPLTAAKHEPQPEPAVRRALRACGDAVRKRLA
jgi:hypothetical protein